MNAAVLCLVFAVLGGAASAGQPPDPVTDLAAQTGDLEGRASLSWSAPSDGDFTPLSHYFVRFATYSAAQLKGDTTAWFNLTASSSLTVSPAHEAGSLETLTIDGLIPGELHYFMVRTEDIAGDVSQSDLKSYEVQAQARPMGIAGITNLSAQPGAVSGGISLAWTEPGRAQSTAPEFYTIKVSTLGNIGTDADFAAALPLSVFSPTPVPAPGQALARRTLAVSGLTPFATYYFAVRLEDSSPAPFAGPWLRDEARGRNRFNYSPPRHIPYPPEPVNDLTALTGGAQGQADLSWTAPRNYNFTPLSHYIVRSATFSAGHLQGDTTAWFNLAASSSLTLSTARDPGTLETLTIGALAPGELYFFMVRSVDKAGDMSQADLKSYGTQAQARPRGIAAVTNLAARPGASSGSMDLAWTEPGRAAVTLPDRYLVRASTMGNLASDAGFAAAQPLSAFSPTAAPAPGAAMETRTWTLTGLTPFTTYYFAIRLEDSSPLPLAGPWLREPAKGLNPSNFSVPMHLHNPPDAVTDITALAGGAEGQVNLSWTAPRNANFTALSRYLVRFATASAAQLGGDAAVWFNLAASSSVTASPAHAPGSLETLTLNGLYPSSTFYFAVKAVDVAGDMSAIDLRASAGVQVQSKPMNFPPAVPSGLQAFGDLNKARVSWNALTSAERGLDFDHYNLYRSTQAAAGFVLVTTAAATSIVDAPLAAFTTYYYRVSAQDQDGLEGAFSSTRSAVPFTAPPMEPLGIRVAGSSDAVTLTWLPTVRFSNGALFRSTSAPAYDELIGYQVLRSTGPSLPFQAISTPPAGQTSFTDLAGGAACLYQVRSYNSIGAATNATVVNNFGQQFFYLDDLVSNVMIEQDDLDRMSRMFNAGAEDIRISRRRRPELVGGNILEAVEFIPMLGGHTPLSGVRFGRPVPVVLRFATAGGMPVPNAAGPAAAEAVRNLGIFWHNGVEYKKLYGAVDPLAQTVTVKTPNLGLFQIRSLYREDSVTFDISNITSRVFTPNDDGKNDVVIFLFDNPNHAVMEGRIYDLRGAFAAAMRPGPMPDSLMWDGRMNGRVAASGVYIYQVNGDGKTFNGALVVAR
ncbi:MAG: hypothetical protein HY922_09365 [Elusimicrobia bacterium]|nr:hypothetical protein [Elusimicrobiota bacterium]